MVMKVKRFTVDEMAAFLELHPKGEPKEWAVMCDDMVYEFVDTEEVAQAQLKEILVDENIKYEFNDWVERIAEAKGTSEDRILKVVMELM